MDIALMPNNRSRHFLSFSQKLFFSVLSIFIVFIIFFGFYQFHREKEYKINLLNIQLQDYNERLAMDLEDVLPVQRDSLLHAYIRKYKGLRLSLIDLQGKVLFDSDAENAHISNHLTRSEIKQALNDGKGYAVHRTSETTGTPYFYSATRLGNYIIRTALPYNVNLIKSLSADLHYLWFMAALSVFLIFLFYKLTNRLGKAIQKLREFAQHADKDEPIETTAYLNFPHDELGEISQHIIQIYKRVRVTKEALYIEREKLITHLQTAREGLGVFHSDNREILVNNLFLQYANLISDENLSTAESIFNVAEFKPVTQFIQSVQQNFNTAKSKVFSLSVEKNGKVFWITCNIFHDLSFEVSMNDITKQEEQIRLKRQLTQNISHELKTPVSSIHGYLETILSAPNLSKEKMNSFLQRCFAQSNRLTRLLHDISLLSRMDDNHHHLVQEKVFLSELVDEIIAEVTLDLEERRMNVFNQLPSDLYVEGDATMLYSIFRNLMDNAIFYAGDGTQVQILCFREDASFYYFSFADNGVGVPEEHLNRLFERFYRIDKGRSRKLGGTGLGLAIVKNAVILHGGTISAKNALGGGLEFIFTLAKVK